MASRKSSKKAPDVLSAAYLEQASSKSELLRRLTNVTETLSTLSEDIDPSTHPGLLSLSTTLVSSSIIGHRDKDVRLHAILACCELFYIYAPEPPFSETEILEIFDQLVRQLGNLQSCELTSSNFDKYYRILEQLSEVKIGVVLVDLIRTERGTSKKGSSSSKRGSFGAGEENDALDTLCDLIRTLLTCVNLDHPPEVAVHAELAVAACIEEFEGNIPIQVLEELLTCVGQGPVVWVTNPAFLGATKKRKSAGSGGKTKGDNKEGGDGTVPSAQIQQTNPSYLLAAKVLRRTEDKISSPIAALLNGLLTGDPHVMGQTSLSTVDADAAALFSAPTTTKGGKKGKKKKNGDSPTLASHLAPKETQPGANVYSITYELHRIAPQILTTVIGTVSTSLRCEDSAKRWQATKLLGRLFSARNSNIAGRFGPCFREWLTRHCDPEPKIRETMVKLLVNFLTTQYVQTELCVDVNEALANLIEKEPTVDIRLLCIHQICDLAHTAATSSNAPVSEVAPDPSTASSKRLHPISIISPELLKAVGDRVASKNKTEHKDAMTGLAQIYHKHYIRQKLEYVQEGGDNVSIEEILEVWKEIKAAKGKVGNSDFQSDEEKFAWIPQRVFECVSYPDSTDAEMRNRIFQIVDDVLLGTTKKESGSTLSPTSCAVGLAIIVDSIKDKNNAYQWMLTLFTQRSCLQKALEAYLDARSKAKECDSGSVEAFTADSEAMEKLELVASLSAPLPESKSPSSVDLESILKKIHSAKDKHIFRILSTISQPEHSPSARLRALDELPKRTKGLGNAVQSWVKTLARRCAMGSFMNAEVIEHCIIVSAECFEADRCEASALFLECVKLATSIFPALGSTKKGFEHLLEFFDASRTTSDLSTSMKKDMEKYDVVTTLSEILARCGGSHPLSSGSGNKSDAEEFDFEGDNKASYDTLREQLLRLCTRDGTPEQARNSVYTIFSMIKPQSASGSAGSLAAHVRKEKKEFEPLLKALVNPSRLSIPDDTTNPKNRGRIVSILSAITAIAECAPYAFNAGGEGSRTGWGQRAIEFALDTVLLGKNTILNASVDEEDSSDSDGDEELSPVKKGRTSKTKRNKTKSNEVSIHCQMLCGAIEVLVSHIRSTIVHGQRNASISGAPKLTPLSSDHIKEVFGTLSKIIEDGGVPPSSVNGRYCKTAKDQAELRRCAAANLLRLCDANMKLEKDYLTPRMWHILSSSLLDSDKSTRMCIMEELCAMYTASGKYRACGAQQVAPNLRFVSLVTLCADADGSGAQHSAANAGAANVGKKTTSVRAAATSLMTQLRTTVQTLQAQCRSKGRSAEKHFENKLKMNFMPEYCVPYALHLLAFRHETASAAGTLPGENESESEDETMSDGGDKKLMHTQEASQKMLKKRLTCLFDPLIKSLGDGADNISFLLRMVELIGKHPPVNVFKTNADVSSLEMSLDDDDDADDIYGNDVDEKEARARMKIICQFAREVLLSQVKKDHNLTVYPGAIQFPADLYGPRRPRSSTSPIPPPRYESDDESEEVKAKKEAKGKPKKSISHYVAKKNDEEVEEEEEEEKSNDDMESEKSVDTREQSPKSASPAAPSDKEDFDFDNDNFGDFSPIAKAVDSPAQSDMSSPKGRANRRSSAGTNKRSSAKKTPSEKKRKIDVFDELLSLPEPNDDEDSPLKPTGSSKKRSKPSPKATRSSNGRRKKSKSSAKSPDCVPIMINIDPNSAGSSSSSKKKKAAKTKVASKKKSPISVEKKDALDFSDSPVKPKASKKALTKKSSAKKAPTKKAQKAKVSLGGASTKSKPTKSKSTGKAKKATVSVESDTKKASSKAPVRRGGRRTSPRARA